MADDFEPVNLKHPDGEREWVAMSPTELVNLENQGYTVARAQAPAKKAEKVVEQVQEQHKGS